jgi:tRNA(Ile)-lysidine synthase
MAITADDLAVTLSPFRSAAHWWLALSGGVDSVALLHLLHELRARLPGPWPPLSALHIHHGLHPAADSWSDHCRELCERLDVAFVEARVVVEATGHGIEAAARAARYAAFEAYLGDGELLLTAHHLDDQAETLLLRLLRGTGVGGAGAMPVARRLGRGTLLRPLLWVQRAEILEYATSRQLLWVEDPSNASTELDRNLLRREILPRLRSRWPRVVEQLARFAAHAREADELLTVLASQDLAQARLPSQPMALSIAALRALTPPRRRLLLRHWLRMQGYPPPSEAQLAQVAAIPDAAADAEPRVCWPGVEVRRYRDALLAMAPLLRVGHDWSAAFAPPGAQSLPGGGLLVSTPRVGGGLRADRDYRIALRHGGERCRPQGRAHSQSLKKLLQAAALPPWWRERLPLLWCGDELAAVADLWVCEGFVAAPGEPGWQLRWQRPGEEPLSSR